MIYEYYGSKEELYKAVLSAVYGRLSDREIGLLSENMSCIDAIKKIIALYFDFLKDNQTFVNLILRENLNKGIYIKDIDFTNIKDPAFELLRRIVQRGRAEGVFHQDIDADQVILSLLTYTFAFFSNWFTLSKLFGRKIDYEENIRKRVENVTEMCK